MKKSLPLLLLLVTSFVHLSCFMNTRSTEKVTVEKKDLQSRSETNVPTKVRLLDASVIEADSGFRLINDTLLAGGIRRQVDSVRGVFDLWRVPLDSVLGVEYESHRTNAGAVVGNVLLGTLYFAATVAAVGALAVAIFGSCPTVYALSGNQEILQAECFSSSIGRQFELADLDRLEVATPGANSLRLRIRNEAMETHYINSLSLGVVYHSNDSKAYPTSDGKVVVVKQLVPPQSAFDSHGNSIINLIAKPDGSSYQTDSASTLRMLGENALDTIDLVVPRPAQSKQMTMVFRARNTLEGTVLFYDILLRDQGADAVRWMQALNEDPLYSWRVGQWYKEFSGLRVRVDDGGVVSETKIYDSGPISWKEVAAHLQLPGKGDSLRVRISMMPDYWMIDWVGFSFETTEPAALSLVGATSIHSRSHLPLPEVLHSVSNDDADYAVTYPGDWFDLDFAIEKKPGLDQTFFLHSQGYYIEWIRGSWLRNDHSLRAFDPSESNNSRRRLAELWLAKKKSFEKEFFDQRAN